MSFRNFIVSHRSPSQRASFTDDRILLAHTLKWSRWKKYCPRTRPNRSLKSC